MPPSSQLASTEHLLECMRQRRNLLLAIRKLTEAQQASTGGSDASVTLGILARKESLIDELLILHQQLQPFHVDVPEQRVWSSPQRRVECQQLSDEGKALLTEILLIEQATIEQLSVKRDAVAAQLQNGTDSILASSAYTAGDLLGESSLDLSNF